MKLWQLDLLTYSQKIDTVQPSTDASTVNLENKMEHSDLLVFYSVCHIDQNTSKYITFPWHGSNSRPMSWIGPTSGNFQPFWDCWKAKPKYHSQYNHAMQTTVSKENSKNRTKEETEWDSGESNISIQYCIRLNLFSNSGMFRFE